MFADVRTGDRRVLQLAKVRRQGQRFRRRVDGTGGPRAARVPVRHVLLGRATGGPLHVRAFLSTFPPQQLNAFRVANGQAYSYSIGDEVGQRTSRSLHFM